jgi:lysozyme
MSITSIEELIAREEGLSLHAVPDTVGVVIGYGRNLTTHGISKEEAEYLRANDIRDARSECGTLPFYAGLSVPRQGVLLSMHFELGFHGLLTFRQMLAHLADGEWDKAADALLDSDYARAQVPDRAHRLSVQLRENRWI